MKKHVNRLRWSTVFLLLPASFACLDAILRLFLATSVWDVVVNRPPLNRRGEPIRYRFIDLGTLGGKNSEATDINDSHQIVGWSEVKFGSALPFICSLDKGHAGPLTPLRVPPDAGYVRATAINEVGMVAGNVGTGQPNQHSDSESVLAAIWPDVNALPVVLPAAPGYENSTATVLEPTGTLAAGQFFGYRPLSTLSDPLRVYEEKAFVFQMQHSGLNVSSGGAAELAVTPPDTVGQMCIIPGGDVLCFPSKKSPPNHLMLLGRDSGSSLHFVTKKDLGEMPGREDGARVLRCSPQGKYVAGTFPSLFDEARTRMLDMEDWERDQRNRSYLSQLDRGRLPRKNETGGRDRLPWQKLSGMPDFPLTTIQDVNDVGSVVGSVLQSTQMRNVNVEPRRHAAVWSNASDTPSDLNDLIPASTGWELITAAGINNRGEIVGSAVRKDGKRQRQFHAFLLIPTKP